LDERKSGTSDEAAETLSRGAARGTGLVFQQQPPPRRRSGAAGRGIGFAVAAAADAIVATWDDASCLPPCLQFIQDWKINSEQ